MFKKILTYLLCGIVAFTTSCPVYSTEAISAEGMSEQDIRALYPQAKILRVEPDEYPQIAEQLRRQGYVATDNSRLAAEKTADSTNGRQRSDEGCDKKSRSKTGSTASEDSLRLVVDVTDDILRSGNNGGGGEGAAVVFVIVGAVVIVVWALYVFKYLYDVAAGFEPCAGWSELTLVSGSISRDSSRHIDFNGMRFMTGFRDGITDVGIAVELGEADILLPEIGSAELTGTYWFLGPILRWRFSNGNNPHYFQMNFMGGSTEHDEIGVIARASLGVRFGIGEHMHLGVSWGAMNVKLNNDQGIVNDGDQYHYLYGVNAGFRF